MDLITTKILVAVLLGILRFIFGVIPMKVYCYLMDWGEKCDSETTHLERHRQIDTFITRLQSFGGGVLFATCFLHMIPEVRNSVDDLKELWSVDAENEFPFSELIICLGFFMVYFIEEFSHWYVHKENQNRTHPIQEPTPVKYIEVEELNHVGDEAPQKNGSAFPKRTLSRQTSIYSMETLNEPDCALKSTKNHRKYSSQMSEISRSIQSEIPNEEDIKVIEKQQEKSLRGLLVVIALSTHSIFEGLAIGLQKSTGNIWYMFTAISVHAATILYCIGFEMALEGVRAKTILIHMAILAIVSPLGVTIGTIITLKSNLNTATKSTSIIVLEGISAGTVLYITFFEVLNREKNRRQYRISRSICIVAGFIMMILLQIIEV